MRKGKKGERPDARKPPIMPRGERVLGYFYIHASTCLGFSDSPPPSLSRSFLGGLPSLVGGVGSLYRTYRALDMRMESAGAKGSYCNERYSSLGLCIFPVRVRYKTQECRYICFVKSSHWP